MTDSRITVATQGALVGAPPDGGVYCVFANLSTKGLVAFTRTDVLSARPDLKRLTSITYEVVSISDAMDAGGIQAEMATLEAQGLEPPLTVFTTTAHLLLDRIPAKAGTTFRVALSKGFKT